MMDDQCDALFESENSIELSQVLHLKQQLEECQFESFCLGLRHEISRIRDLNTELPMCLEALKSQSLLMDAPDCIWVLCYPFSQECFIYHALASGLPVGFIRKIKQILLPLSSQMGSEHRIEPVYIDGQPSNLLFIGQDFTVWRLYYNVDKNVHLPPLFTILDDAIRLGFQDRNQQQRYIQEVLEQERKAFSAELHDSIAQILGFLRIKSSQLHQKCKQPPYKELIEHTEEIANYTHYAYQQVRELITASRLAYQELDFIVALRKVIEEFEQQSSIVFELDHPVHQVNIQPKQSIQVLYIVRESLSNIVRHSHASYADIGLDIQNNLLNIRISDNGQGIRPALKRKDSFGLEIMQERAERIGAELKIYPEKPQGTCVHLTLKLNEGS